MRCKLQFLFHESICANSCVLCGEWNCVIKSPTGRILTGQQSVKLKAAEHNGPFDSERRGRRAQLAAFPMRTHFNWVDMHSAYADGYACKHQGSHLSSLCVLSRPILRCRSLSRCLSPRPRDGRAHGWGMERRSSAAGLACDTNETAIKAFRGAVSRSRTSKSEMLVRRPRNVYRRRSERDLTLSLVAGRTCSLARLLYVSRSLTCI